MSNKWIDSFSKFQRWFTLGIPFKKNVKKFKFLTNLLLIELLGSI